LASLFPLLTQSSIDWNFTTTNEGNTAQYHDIDGINLPAGKVLGGSSSLHHFYHVRGVSNDYESWANASQDESWNWDGLLPYFIKSETLEDPLINSTEYGQYHGSDGPTKLTRELNDATLRYLQAFEEIGKNIEEDINIGSSYGFSQPMFTISNSIRQSSAESYLSPIKEQSNLHVMKNTEVIKILFDDDNNAIGVEAVTSAGETIKLYANNEVIVSAGTFNTPKLLMLSGIGPKDTLESLDIDVISDLPVGQNLQDHMAVVVAHQMEETDAVAAAADPGKFPVPTFVGYSAVDSTQTYPDYISLNLICKNIPSIVAQLCSVVIPLKKEVCEEIITAATERELLFSVLTKSRPWSVGTVSINSTSYLAAPVIETGYLTDERDLEENAAYLEDFVQVAKSSVFQGVGATTVSVTLPSCANLTVGSTDYWKCYAQSMMSTTYHYCCTAPMGTVLDSKLLVKGVQKLRVVDASAMPQITSGNINAPILALAEKAADLIKDANTCSSK
ncbi:unnamed protein product, partial [Leptidea sinapis]